MLAENGLYLISMSKEHNTLFNHIKNFVLLPGTVAIIIPLLLYHYTTPLIPMNVGKLSWLGWIILIFGLLFLFWSIILFYRIGKGTLAPWNPTSNLVISGPYRLVRNPMIVGVLNTLIGEGLAFGQVNILYWAILFFFMCSAYFVFVEEPELEKRFGEDYVKYRRNVSRWVPRIIPYKPSA